MFRKTLFIIFCCFFVTLKAPECFAIGPSIDWVRIYPVSVAPDGKTRVAIYAKVSHPAGLRALKEVVVNLGPIGGFGNSKLGDDGWLGDERGRDGIYTILASVSRGIPFGRKLLVVTAFDDSGWKTYQEGILDVLDMPAVLNVSASRGRVPADGRTPVLITARIFSPTGLPRVKYVLADLGSIGGGKRVIMRNDGRGEDTAVDEWWSVKTIVPQNISPGWKVLRVSAINVQNNVGVRDVSLYVEK